MSRFFTRPRLAMGLAVFGVALMGVDLLMTGNFFVHSAELMGVSILCFVLALLIDRGVIAGRSEPDKRSRK